MEKISIITKINIFVQGFIICALLASATANIAMYNGYLINKSKLSVTVCTAIADAVSNSQPTPEEHAIDRYKSLPPVKPVKLKE
jgi:hypothetical protein